MNKYCLWKGEGDNAKLSLLFKYKFKKEYSNEVDCWSSYCCVDDIIKIFSETTFLNTYLKLPIKKINGYWYIYINKCYCSFWNNVFTEVFEFEAEDNENALLIAELKR